MFCNLEPIFRIGRIIAGVGLCALLGAASLGAQQEQTFRGEIIDSSICAGAAGHASMLDSGETAASGTVACVKKHAKYVLAASDDQTVYQLDNQRKPKAFAGEKVIVTGVLDKPSDTIHVGDIVAALSSKVSQAKSAYIDCDACPRAMADAGLIAYHELQDWARFDLAPDRRHADLVFLFSANSYLGDYVTRDGPDTRPVFIEVTYMNVIDPATGESLWSDSRRWGSLLVGRATKDMILEFKEQLEEGEGRTERLLSRMDKNGDGKISKKEFMDFMESEFDRLDTDKDGYLDATELRQLRVVSVGK